jgi:aryl carrier-like protein
LERNECSVWDAKPQADISKVDSTIKTKLKNDKPDNLTSQGLDSTKRLTTKGTQKFGTPKPQADISKVDSTIKTKLKNDKSDNLASQGLDSTKRLTTKGTQKFGAPKELVPQADIPITSDEDRMESTKLKNDSSNSTTRSTSVIAPLVSMTLLFSIL